MTGKPWGQDVVERAATDPNLRMPTALEPLPRVLQEFKEAQESLHERLELFTRKVGSQFAALERRLEPLEARRPGTPEPRRGPTHEAGRPLPLNELERSLLASEGLATYKRERLLERRLMEAESRYAEAQRWISEASDFSGIQDWIREEKSRRHVAEFRLCEVEALLAQTEGRFAGLEAQVEGLVEGLRGLWVAKGKGKKGPAAPEQGQGQGPAPQSYPPATNLSVISASTAGPCNSNLPSTSNLSMASDSPRGSTRSR